MVTGYYGALAAAASVFIGVLTALLASNLANLRVQRRRVEKRIEAIDAQLENLDSEYQTFSGELEAIREQEEQIEQRESAEEDVDDFISNYVGVEWNPTNSSVSLADIEIQLREYLEQDPNQHHRDVLEERSDEVEEILETNTDPFRLGHTISDSAFTDSAIIASNNQIEHQWEMHRNEQYNRTHRQWIQTMTEIRSLREERSKLVKRHQSLDPSVYKGTLLAVAGSVLCTVAIPLFAYFLHVIDLQSFQIPTEWEALLVTILWTFGLAVVFLYLWREINDGPDKLPGEPDLQIDEDASVLSS